jgi:hypothetical protein
MASCAFRSRFDSFFNPAVLFACSPFVLIVERRKRVGNEPHSINIKAEQWGSALSAGDLPKKDRTKNNALHNRQSRTTKTHSRCRSFASDDTHGRRTGIAKPGKFDPNNGRAP